MKLRIEHPALGVCQVDTKRDIGKAEEYTIKSLMMLQLACMNVKDRDKFNEFINIMSEAISKADKVYDDNLAEEVIDDGIFNYF